MKVEAAFRFAVILLVFPGCGREHNAQPGSAPSTEAQSKASTATLKADARSISHNDADILAGLSDLTSKWNRVAAPLVRDYLDPNVPADRWVKNASAQVAGLRAVHLELRTSALGIQDPGIRQTILEIVQNYRSKLDSITALHHAMAAGDQDAEKQALERSAAASAEGQKLAESFLDRLRPFVDPSELTAALKKRGKDIGTLMTPQ